MSLYTGKGDDGKTFCMLYGKKIPKDHPIIEFLGSLDESNSALGVARSYMDIDSEEYKFLIYLQKLIFRVGFTIAGKKSVSIDDVKKLEEYSDKYYREAPLKSFILPGGDSAISHLHLARTIVRRAERRFISLIRDEDVPEQELTIKILNRLSDAIFALALYLAKKRGIKNITL